MRLGNTEISSVKLGSSQVQAVYLGNTLVWQNAPVATAATGVGSTSFTANWNAYTGATYYLLDVSTSSSFSTFVYENQIVEAPTTSYVVIGLEPNTTYYYRVRASTEALPLLLDTYSGAAAAYSLRLLSNTYTGSAIRVRRASDNTEQDIGFVSNELDTSALTTFCSGTNGFVKTWYDQSGNGRDATQISSANQPQIVSSGIFVGFVDFLGTSSVALNTNYSYINTQGFISFGIVQNNGNAVLFSSDNPNIFYGVSESGSSTDSYQIPQFVSLQNFKNGVTLGLTRNDMHNATISFACITTQAHMYNTPKLIFGYPAAGAYNNIRYKEYVLYGNQTISRSGVESNIITYYGL